MMALQGVIILSKSVISSDQESNHYFLPLADDCSLTNCPTEPELPSSVDSTKNKHIDQHVLQSNNTKVGPVIVGYWLTGC